MSHVLQWTQFAALIFSFGAPFSSHHLVNSGGAEILARVAEFADAAVAANIRIEHDEVARLILFVPRAGVIDVGEPVECKLAVALETARLVHERAVAMEICVFLVARLRAHRDQSGRGHR